MKQPPHEAILDSLVEVARPIILEQFRPDSCIASTRIGLDVLRYFNLQSTALPMSAMVFNAEANQILTSEGFEALPQVLAEHHPDGEGGPWSIGVGMGAPLSNNSWAGHLVIGLPQHQTIIDLSFDQARRVHKQIAAEPYWAVVPSADWWTDDAPDQPDKAVFPIEHEDGTLILLNRRVPDASGYRTSPNWTLSNSERRREHKDMVGRIIRLMRQDLST